VGGRASRKTKILTAPDARLGRVKRRLFRGDAAFALLKA
jgi:hypothetical protein